MTGKCVDCKFAHALGPQYEPVWGFCRRYPPSTIARKVIAKHGELLTHLPPIDPNDYCGEYVPKLIAAPPPGRSVT